MMFLGHVLPLVSNPGGAKCQRKSHQVISHQLDHRPLIPAFLPEAIDWRSNQASHCFISSVLLAIAISFGDLLTGNWYAVFPRIFDFEPLDHVSERWLKEACPGEYLNSDVEARKLARMRSHNAAKN